MSNEIARFLFHIYVHYENKNKHIGDGKYGNNASFSASLRTLRETFL